jgi:photosystem II stability/assembly factor-like uncharacterized protein
MVAVVAFAGVAGAATVAQQSTMQPRRSWENYFGVTILPSGRAVVVGDKGVVMTTDDHGRTWSRQQLKRGKKYYDLYSVGFESAGLHGWTVGDNGTIFHTDDSGATWSQQPAPAGASIALLKVAAIDARKACASGEQGVILCTSDGGVIWNLQKFQDIGFFDIAFADANDGWAVGEFATVLQTNDGGKSWKVQSGGDRMGKSDPYFAIAFSGEHDGLAVGLIGSALESNDSGKTWKASDLSVENRSYYTVSAIPARTGEFYAAGEDGMGVLIARGRVSKVQSGTSNAITSVAFSPQFAIAVGLHGTLLRSDDGGQHWHSVE